jgi:hypothetical protein
MQGWEDGVSMSTAANETVRRPAFINNPLVAFQRTVHKRMLEGDTDSLSLTPDRIKRLEEIGFKWSAKRQNVTSRDAPNQQRVEIAVRQIGLKVA